MANEVVVVFDDVKAFFSKVFKSAPKWTVTALASINLVAPEAELVLALVDPAAAAVADPIITEVEADLGTVATMLKAGNTVNLATFLTAIKTNLSKLLTAGHITNPESVNKATGIVNAIVQVVDSILAEVSAQAA